MADVNISKYTTQVVREGSKPASPGFVVSEGQDPVNPPGTNNYVPYSGATANVELGEYGLETGFVTLDTTPTNIPTEQGGIYWDDSRSTAALIMNGTLQHIGQDSFFYVKNQTGSTIPKGTAVRFDGSNGGSGHILIAPFLADGTYPSNYFVGVTAEAIANGAFGQVMHFGELEGINTSAYSEGALLYASTTVAGGFQTTPPVAPNNIVLIAAAINSKNNGNIAVRPTYGSNINQDEGVKITSPSTGQLLQLQAGGLWENKTKAQILGGTSSQFVKGDGSLDSTSYQPLLTNPVTGTGTTNFIPKFTGSTTIGDSVIADNATEVSINKRVFINNSVHSISFQPNNSGVSNRIESTNLPLEIITAGASLILAAGGVSPQISLASTGVVTLSNLAGSGTRMVVANASGVLSTQAIAANQVTGTGTTNYLPKFTGTSTIGNSNLINDANGNLGLGVTPSAWNSSFKALQIAGSNGIGAHYTGSSYTAAMYSNAYASISASTYYSQGTAFGSSWYNQFNGEHLWLSAPAVATLSTALNWTQAMTLTSGGNLLVGTTTDAGFKLDVNGTGRFFRNDSANISLTISNSFINQGNLINFIHNSNGSTTNAFIGHGGDSTGNLIFINNSIQALTIARSTGNVGIGTTAPVSLLNLYGDTNLIQLQNSTTGNTGADGTRINLSGADLQIINREFANMIFYTSDTERMRITSSGNVLIGGTTDLGKATVINDNNDANSGQLVVAGSTSTLKRLSLGYNTTSNYGFISVYTALSGYNPLALQPLGGNVLIGTTTDNGARLQVSGAVNSRAATTNAGLGATTFIGAGEFMSTGSLSGYFWENRSGGVTSTSNWYGWYTTSGTIYLYNGSANIASINTSTGAYTALSDKNKKKDFEQSNLGLNEILNLKPTLYRMNSDSEDMQKQLGFLAQEVKEYIPQAYVESEDFIGLNYNSIIPVLVKAIQELKQEIDTLKN